MAHRPNLLTCHILQSSCGKPRRQEARTALPVKNQRLPQRTMNTHQASWNRKTDSLMTGASGTSTRKMLAVALIVVALGGVTHAWGSGPGPQSLPSAAVTVASPASVPLLSSEEPLPRPGMLYRLFNPVVGLCERSVHALTGVVAVPFSVLDRCMERWCPSSRPAGMGLPKPAPTPAPGPQCPSDRPRKCPLL
jgi:hypothetical protein